jgi:hypothetical protein
MNELKLSAEDERKFQETKQALEKEIHKRFVKELVLRSQRQTTTQEQQAHLEQLYFDLKFINPELAFATLKASALITARAHELQHQKSKEKEKEQEERKEESQEEEEQKPRRKHSHSNKQSSSAKVPLPSSKSKSKSGSNKEVQKTKTNK